MKLLAFLFYLILSSSALIAKEAVYFSDRTINGIDTQICNNQDDKQYYLYCIVSFDMGKDKKIKVDVDNGVEITRLRNSKGDMKFKTRAAVLMYFIDKGWEFVSLSSSTEVSGAMGTVGSDTNGFWIFRKPCTKEEFDNIVKQGIR